MRRMPANNSNGILGKFATIRLFFTKLLKKSAFPVCSKRARCKAPEIMRSEAYSAVRCNDLVR